MNLIDSHSHFDDASFDPDRGEALARAHAAGVIRQVVPAVSAALWPHQREVCAQYAGLYAAYGLHPMYLEAHRPAHLDLLREWIQQEKPVAVGEFGLDFYVEGLDRAAQWEYFDAQLQIAGEFSLPVILHARRCLEEMILHLRNYPGLRGVVHSFSGSLEQAERLIEQGFYLSFGGPVTYPRAKRLHKVLKQLPRDAILLETDAPDQPLSGRQGQRNEPAWLAEVLQAAATARGEDPAELAQAAWNNTVDLFNLIDFQEKI